MATFSGNAAGYRIDVLANGKIRVVDIDSSDGDTGKHFVSPGDDVLSFDDRNFGLSAHHETPINTDGIDLWSGSAVAALADGGYVVVWEAASQSSNATDYDDIHFQRFDAAGNPVGGETLVNTLLYGFQNNPAITGLADGG